MKKIYFILAVFILGGIFSYSYYKNNNKDTQFKIAISPTPISKSYFKKQDIPMPKNIPSAHAASVVYLQNGDLLTAFFAGSREGASDVKIYGSIYNARTQKWGQPFILISREWLSDKSKQYIKKLGNPVLYRQNDRIYLFVVGTSIGGWATSKIYQLYADNFWTDRTFKYKQTLYLSPFINISNLVRTRPVATIDGGFILPIYHELADKYALILKFDSNGDIKQIIKPNSLHHQLQPSITPINQSECVVVFRNYRHSDNTMFSQTCSDGGNIWNKPQKTNIKNYDNSLNLIDFNHNIYLIYNTSFGNLNRGRLTLSKMLSPTQFIKIKDLDYTKSKQGEVSYPTTITNGQYIDIVYTYDRKNIRHIRFNQSYLKEIQK